MLQMNYLYQNIHNDDLSISIELAGMVLLTVSWTIGNNKFRWHFKRLVQLYHLYTPATANTMFAACHNVAVLKSGLISCDWYNIAYSFF